MIGNVGQGVILVVGMLLSLWLVLRGLPGLADGLPLVPRWGR